MIHAAAPCPVPIKWAMLDWWGDCIYEYYAATEGGGTHRHARRAGGRTRARSATPGRSASCSSWTTTAPVPDRDPRHDLHEDDRGLAFEYKGDAAKTEANRLKDYFTVGDIGYLDEDGFLFLSDRKADMIISGGTNIYPAEIENELMVHPKVADVAVFGIPDDEWGEQIKAVVEPGRGRRRPARAGRGDPRLAGGPAGPDEVAEVDRLHRGDAARAQRQAPQTQAA